MAQDVLELLPEDLLLLGVRRQVQEVPGLCQQDPHTKYPRSILAHERHLLSGLKSVRRTYFGLFGALDFVFGIPKYYLQVLTDRTTAGETWGCKQDV